MKRPSIFSAPRVTSLKSRNWLGLPPLRPAAGPGGGDDALEIDAPSGRWLLRRQVRRDERGDERRGPSRCDGANHEALLDQERPATATPKHRRPQRVEKHPLEWKPVVTRVVASRSPGRSRDFSAAMRKASLSCPVVIISILTNEFVGSKRRGLTFDVSPLLRPSLAFRVASGPDQSPNRPAFARRESETPAVAGAPVARSRSAQKKARARPHGIVKARRPDLESERPINSPSANSEGNAAVRTVHRPSAARRR